MGRIVEVRAIIRLVPPMPATRQQFKNEVARAFSIAQKDAAKLPSTEDYSFATIFEEIARLAEVALGEQIKKQPRALFKTNVEMALKRAARVQDLSLTTSPDAVVEHLLNQIAICAAHAAGKKFPA